MSSRTIKFVYLSVGILTILTGFLIYLTNRSIESNELQTFTQIKGYTSVIVILGGFMSLITTLTLNKFTALLSGMFLIMSGFVFLILQTLFGIIIMLLGITALVFRYKLTYF